MKKNSKIREYLSENLSGLYVSAELRTSLKNEILGGKKMKMKLSVGLVCVIVLMLITVTALAITAVQSWVNNVAQMQIEGAFSIWGLNDKLRFVEVMKSEGLEIDESLYQTLVNTALDYKARNAAADQIIDDRYGDIMREDAKTWVEEPDTVVGMPPDPIYIFREAYYAQYPKAADQEYTDALALWLRDIARRYEAMTGGEGQADRSETNEAYATACVRDRISNKFEISDQAADDATIHVEFDEKYQVWVCTGKVVKESVPVSVRSTIRMSDDVLDVGNEYEICLVVDQKGDIWDNVTAEEYAVLKAAQPIWSYTSEQCDKIATQGVMDFFKLTPTEAGRYFLLSADTYSDEKNNAILVVLFKEHSNALYNEWTYAAIVNAGTGEMLDCFNVDMLWDRLPSLAKEYPNMTEEEKKNALMWYDARYNPDGNYIHWTEERKAQWSALFGSR